MCVSMWHVMLSDSQHFHKWTMAGISNGNKLLYSNMLVYVREKMLLVIDGTKVTCKFKAKSVSTIRFKADRTKHFLCNIKLNLFVSFIVLK